MRLNLQVIPNTFVALPGVTAFRFETRHKDYDKDCANIHLPSHAKDYHLVLNNAEGIAACIILSPQETYKAIIHKLHIEDSVWQPGIEKRLIAYAEEWAAELGFDEVIIKCGNMGRSFFQKLSYHCNEENNTNCTGSYYEMVKPLILKEELVLA